MARGDLRATGNTVPWEDNQSKLELNREDSVYQYTTLYTISDNNRIYFIENYVQRMFDTMVRFGSDMYKLKTKGKKAVIPGKSKGCLRNQSNPIRVSCSAQRAAKSFHTANTWAAAQTPFKLQRAGMLQETGDADVSPFWQCLKWTGD